MPDYEAMSIKQLESYRAQQQKAADTALANFRAAGKELSKRLRQAEIEAKRAELEAELAELEGSDG